MKIDQTCFALTALSGLALGGAAVLALTGTGSHRAVVAAIGLSVTAGMWAVALWWVTKVGEMVEAHATRIEAATAEHAKLLSQHVLALERFFAMGQQSDRLAQAAAHDVRGRSIRDTGSFQLYKGDAG